jgi:hypothetical protein
MGQSVRTIRGKGFPTLPTGTYFAVLRDVEDESGQYGPRFKWLWDVDIPGQLASHELRQWTNTTTTPGAVAGKIIKALTGRFLARGEDLDTDELVGKRVVLDVTLDDENARNVIEGVRAAPQLAGAPSPGEPPLPEPDPVWDDEPVGLRL